MFTIIHTFRHDSLAVLKAEQHLSCLLQRRSNFVFSCLSRSL